MASTVLYVSPHERRVSCAEPALGDLLTPYCFGDLDEGGRAAFEAHLLVCDVCWDEVVALKPAVSVLRADRSLVQTLAPTEVAGLLGLSAAIDEPFAGHRAHVVVWSVLYALLFTIPVFVEVAYRWDVWGVLAMAVAPPVFVVMVAATLGALALQVRAGRHRRGGLAGSLGVLVGSAALVSALVVAVFPAAPTVDAAFQTYPAHLGYLKSVFYAHLVGPAFVLLPFAFVVAMQSELRHGRHQQVLWLLNGDGRAVAPRGVYYVQPWGLLVYLGLLLAFHVLGVSHLFDNLSDGPYRHLFMALVMARVGASLVLPCVCVWWYGAALNDLRRECLAVMSFGRRGDAAGG